MFRIDLASFEDALGSLDPGTIDHIITSPPFIGLPGRGDTRELVARLLDVAETALATNGTITLIVGAAPGNQTLPYEIARMLDGHESFGAITTWIWDREGTMARDVGNQIVTHDFILHARRPLAPWWQSRDTSIIRTHERGFDFGLGVSTPPDIARILVDAVSPLVDEVICDPFCGLGEIGLAAIHARRGFIGCDINEACVTIARERLAATGALEYDAGLAWHA